MANPHARSSPCHHPIAHGGVVRASADVVAGYDENIRQHQEKINLSRSERITLRYFPTLLCEEVRNVCTISPEFPRIGSQRITIPTFQPF